MKPMFPLCIGMYATLVIVWLLSGTQWLSLLAFLELCGPEGKKCMYFVLVLNIRLNLNFFEKYSGTPLVAKW